MLGDSEGIVLVLDPAERPINGIAGSFINVTSSTSHECSTDMDSHNATAMRPLQV